MTIKELKELNKNSVICHSDLTDLQKETFVPWAEKNGCTKSILEDDFGNSEIAYHLCDYNLYIEYLLSKK